jgi:hypothetical protein
MDLVQQRQKDGPKQIQETRGDEICRPRSYHIEQTALQRQIKATDEQIDALVYELYGLTEEEIRIVEENAG